MKARTLFTTASMIPVVGLRNLRSEDSQFRNSLFQTNSHVEFKRTVRLLKRGKGLPISRLIHAELRKDGRKEGFEEDAFAIIERWHRHRTDR